MSERVPLGPLVLATLNVVMVATCLAMTIRSGEIRRAEAELRERFDRQAEAQLTLHGLVAALDRPANEVLVDGDVAVHREELARGVARYRAGRAAVVEAADGLGDRDLGAVDDLVERMVFETEAGLAAVERGDLSVATPHMVRVDAELAEAHRAFDQLRRQAVDAREVAEDRLVADGEAVGRLGWGLGAVVTATTLLTVAQLVRDGRRRAAEQADRERLLADLRRARSDAEAASRAKSEFLANMSHEIRTPMTAILGYADLLLDVHQAPSERLDCVQTVRRNGEHLLQLVNDILDLSKIEAGRLDVEALQSDPGSIVAEVASLMQVRASERGVLFEARYDGPVPSRIVTDPMRVRQILLNLVGNALKFTERGSVVLIARCAPERQRLEFEVTDTGPGMSEETIGRLFRPFTQADTSTTRQYGGTGLGLTISRRLARMLGGDIAVRSVVGEGTTFTVWVSTGPVEGVPTSASPVQRATVTRQALPKVRGRVLLAEDGPDNQRLLSSILRLAGAEVEVVDNGRSAVDRALAAEAGGTPFGVVLMDMQMPVLDGYGATSLLRAHGFPRPVVALTAHAMHGDREKCLRAGCDDYETKPVDRASLLRTVSRYLQTVGVTEPGPVVESPVRSTYSDDPEMQPLIEDFCRELPLRVDEMSAAWSVGDRDRLQRIAHQLRGAGGAYGFAIVTDVCRQLEESLRGGVGDPTPHLTTLRDLVRRITASAQAA